MRPFWLSLFDGRELQVLISGDVRTFDIADLKAHTDLKGYNSSDTTIKNLWKVLESFGDEDRAKFLKFVTSAPRAPMFGMS
jgi:hypothetical protein